MTVWSPNAPPRQRAELAWFWGDSITCGHCGNRAGWCQRCDEAYCFPCDRLCNCADEWRAGLPRWSIWQKPQGVWSSVWHFPRENDGAPSTRSLWRRDRLRWFERPGSIWQWE